jgi:hypothetical protein
MWLMCLFSLAIHHMVPMLSDYAFNDSAMDAMHYMLALLEMPSHGFFLQGANSCQC